MYNQLVKINYQTKERGTGKLNTKGLGTSFQTTFFIDFFWIKICPW